MPTLSDGAGGPGYLEVAQEYFTPLAAAFATILAASIAEEIIRGLLPFEALYYFVALAIVLNLAISQDRYYFSIQLYESAEEIAWKIIGPWLPIMQWRLTVNG